MSVPHKIPTAQPAAADGDAVDPPAPREWLINDALVVSIRLAPSKKLAHSSTEVERLKEVLSKVCNLDPESPVILWGRAHHVRTNSRFFESNSGCTADLILYDPESPAQQKHAEIKIVTGHKGA